MGGGHNLLTCFQLTGNSVNCYLSKDNWHFYTQKISRSGVIFLPSGLQNNFSYLYGLTNKPSLTVRLSFDLCLHLASNYPLLFPNQLNHIYTLFVLFPIKCLMISLPHKDQLVSHSFPQITYHISLPFLSFTIFIFFSFLKYIGKYFKSR